MPTRAEGAAPLLDAAFMRRLESLALGARRAGTGSERGQHRAHGAGRGVAFAGHRAYARGDDVRAVDWPLYARSARLFIKQHEDERDLPVHVLLDCSASMGVPRAKFHAARALAAALSYIALARLDSLSVLPYDAAPRAGLSGLRGRGAALAMMRHLAALEPTGATRLAEAARHVVVRARHGGLAFVVSDGHAEADLLEGIDRLRYARLSPTLLLVTDPDDALPALHGELTLVDAESGLEHTVRITERLRARFRASLAARRAALGGALQGRGVRHFTLSAADSIERSIGRLAQQGGLGD